MRVHKKSKAGKPPKPPKNSEKSRPHAKNSISCQNVLLSQLTPENNTSRHPRSPPSLLTDPNTLVKKQQYGQGLTDYEPSSSTPNIVAPASLDETLLSLTAGGSPTLPSSFHVKSSQQFQRQIEIPDWTAPQAIGFGSGNMDRGLQSALPKRVRSSASSLPETNGSNTIQQIAAPKTERPLLMCPPWSHESPSSLQQASLGYQSPDNLNVPSERSWPFGPVTLPCEPFQHEHGLPSIPCQNTSFSEDGTYSNSFQTAFPNHTQSTPFVDYETIALRLNEITDYNRTFPYPSR